MAYHLMVFAQADAGFYYSIAEFAAIENLQADPLPLRSRMMKLLPAIALTALLSCAPDLLSAKVTGAETCHAETSETARLACYDLLTGFVRDEPAANTATKAEVSAAPSGQHWGLSEQESALDGRNDVWLSVPSENTQPNTIGIREKARLWLRCMENSTNAFIGFTDYVSESQSVVYRLDDNSPQSIWMEPMNDGEGIGLWSGRRAIPFVQSLLDRDRLVVSFDSFSNMNLEFVFDVSGLRARVDPLAEACQWQP